MKKVLALVLALCMVLTLFAGCSNEKTPDPDPTPTPDVTDPTPTPDPDPVDEYVRPTEYVREDEEEVYYNALADYEALLLEAEEGNDPNMRFAMMAKAEALLLDSAVFIPNTTQNGTIAINRVAPRTIPYVQWGNDDDRLGTMVIANDFLTPEERSDLLALWEAAKLSGGEYDAVGYLTGNGYTLQKDYTTTFSTAPVTIDWLNTSSQSDTEVTVNTVDGLVQYDSLSRMQPKLATDWHWNDDKTEITFNIREGVYWYTSEGQKYAEVTAQDFVAGFQHMLDTQAGLEWLVEGVVAGASEYLNGGSFDDVGYKAPDKYTLVVTLEKPTSYFETMLTYSCFLPICDSFYRSRGGVYGMEEYAAASADTNAYTFGLSTDVASQVYCGPYLLQKLNKDSEVYLVRNNEYYDNDKIMLDSIKFVYDNGEDPVALYNAVVAGTYTGCNVTSASIKPLAKADGNYDEYGYVTETTSTTYFGALNLNRGTFQLESGAVATPQTEDNKIDTHLALNNKNFRKALLYAWDREVVNAASGRGDQALGNLRNMYCHPDFVSLDADVTYDGHTFPAGTSYGTMVQAFCDDLGMGINVQDGVNGWYDPAKAAEYLEAAIAELDGKGITYPIQIDVVYYSASTNLTAQASATKQTIEANLGADKVQINLVEATTSDDFYASGYRASNGEAGNFDFFYGSGWGPDYGDPSTYLDTFKGLGAGYMTKTIGLF